MREALRNSYTFHALLVTLPEEVEDHVVMLTTYVGDVDHSPGLSKLQLHVHSLGLTVDSGRSVSLRAKVPCHFHSQERKFLTAKVPVTGDCDWLFRFRV